MKNIRIFLGIALMVAPATMLGGCNDEPADAMPAKGTPSSAAPATHKPSFDTLVIPNGTRVLASLVTPLATDVNQSGDAFTATTDEPIIVGGRTLMPSGSQIHGVLQGVEKSGRIEGRAQMTLLYQSIVDPKGQRYAMSAVPLMLQAASGAHGDIEKIAAGTVLGAIVGAVANGGKGAAIGAGVGAGAGTIYVLATKGDDLALNPGQKLSILTTSATSVEVASR
jgi:hypothetical protein